MDWQIAPADTQANQDMQDRHVHCNSCQFGGQDGNVHVQKHPKVNPFGLMWMSFTRKCVAMDSVTSVELLSFRMIHTSRTVCRPMPFNKAADRFLFILISE